MRGLTDSLRQIQDKPATAGFVVSGAEEQANCFARVGDSKGAPLRESRRRAGAPGSP